MRLTECYLALGVPEEAKQGGRRARRQLSGLQMV